MGSGISKIVANGDAIVDITNDTVTAASLSNGITALARSGALITGSVDFHDSPEYVQFDSSNTSDMSEGAFYCCKTDGLITVNTAAKMGSPNIGNFASEILPSINADGYKVGQIPASWGASKSVGTSCSSRNTDKDIIISDDNQYLYYAGKRISLATTVEGTVVSSAYALIVPDIRSTVSLPRIDSKWSFTSDYNSNGFLNTSSTEITMLKFDNIVYISGTINLSSDQGSGDWITLFALPEKYKPPVDIGVPFRLSPYSIQNGALLSDGSFQLKTVAKKTFLGAVISHGTEAGIPLQFTVVYPLNLGTKKN